jgi:hypothetical protein
MVSRYAVMLDETGTGLSGRQRNLVEHLTCDGCGGHHAMALNGSGSDAPTHQCRDCGFQWTRTSLHTGVPA